MIKVERSPLARAGRAWPASIPSRTACAWRASAATPRPTTGSPGLLELVDDIDLAFDATSAGAHAEHARLLAERGHPQRRPDAGRARPGGRAAREPRPSTATRPRST